MFSFRSEAAIDEATLKSIRQRLQNTDKQSDANGLPDNVENIADYRVKKPTSYEPSSNDIALDDYELIDENDSWTSSDTYPINRPTYSPLEETAGFDEEDELVEYGDSEGHHGPSSEAGGANYNNNEESDEAVEDSADYAYMTASAFQSNQSINNTENFMKQQTIPSVTANKEQVIQNPIEPIRMRSAGGQQYKMPAATPVINFSNEPEAPISQIIEPEVSVDLDNFNDIDKAVTDYQNFASTDLPTQQDAQSNTTNTESEEAADVAWDDKSYDEEEYLSAPTETDAQDYTLEAKAEDFEPLTEKREEDPYGFTSEQEGINDDDFAGDQASEDEEGDDDRDYGEDEDSYENEDEYAEEDEDEEDDMLQQTTKTALSRLMEAKATHNNRATDNSSAAVTLQDFTASILEREIKKWLNAKLPALVNQIVQEKIDKLTSE